jgi:hypothetical protein
LKEAKTLIEKWRMEYNTLRLHSSLKYRPPTPEAYLNREIKRLNDIWEYHMKANSSHVSEKSKTLSWPHLFPSLSLVVVPRVLIIFGIRTSFKVSIVTYIF